MTEKEAIKYIEQHGFIDDAVKDMAIKALKRQSIEKQLLVKSITDKLEVNSFWTEATIDEDGYCHDDSKEVVFLDKAIEIVKEEVTE